jgi:hypothetical protein
MKKRSAGMGTKHGEPVTREPIASTVCEHCGATMTVFTSGWDANLRAFVCLCRAATTTAPAASTDAAAATAETVGEGEQG